jgi:hypothetical protein
MGEDDERQAREVTAEGQELFADRCLKKGRLDAALQAYEAVARLESI